MGGHGGDNRFSPPPPSAESRTSPDPENLLRNNGTPPASDKGTPSRTNRVFKHCFKIRFQGMILNISRQIGGVEMKEHGNNKPEDRSLYMAGKRRR